VTSPSASLNMGVGWPWIVRSYSTRARLALAASLVLAAIVVAVGVRALTSSGEPAASRSATSPAAAPQVACANTVGSQSKPSPGQRIVLGTVQLSPRRLPGQPKRLKGTSVLPYSAKYGLLLRAGGPPVVLAVPTAWRGRAGILWGGSTPRPVVRFPSCPGADWQAFAGGFRLKDRSACVPLDVRAGARQAHIRIGIGHACRLKLSVEHCGPSFSVERSQAAAWVQHNGLRDFDRDRNPRHQAPVSREREIPMNIGPQMWPTCGFASDAIAFLPGFMAAEGLVWPRLRLKAPELAAQGVPALAMRWPERARTPFTPCQKPAGQPRGAERTAAEARRRPKAGGRGSVPVQRRSAHRPSESSAGRHARTGESLPPGALLRGPRRTRPPPRSGMTSPSSLAATMASAESCDGEDRSPAHAANATRNAQAMWWRAARWRPARAALWRLLERYVDPADRVAVIGAGNADDVPLRPLRRRAGHVDLIDLDAAALRRAQRRLGARRRVLGMVLEDVTFGRADAITRAVVNGHAPPPRSPKPRHVADTYDGRRRRRSALHPAALPGTGRRPTPRANHRPHNAAPRPAAHRRRRRLAARQRPTRRGRPRPRPPRLVARTPATLRARRRPHARRAGPRRRP